MGAIEVGELPLAPGCTRANVADDLSILWGEGAEGTPQHVVIDGGCVGGVGAMWVGGGIPGSLGHLVPEVPYQLPW